VYNRHITLGGNRLARESYIFLTLGLTPRPSTFIQAYFMIHKNPRIRIGNMKIPIICLSLVLCLSTFLNIVILQKIAHIDKTLHHSFMNSPAQDTELQSLIEELMSPVSDRELQTLMEETARLSRQTWPTNTTPTRK